MKQAVLLAGGKSSRFRPFSVSRHKSELPLLGRSLMERTVKALGECGIKSIVIIHSPKHKPSIRKSGKSINYIVQPRPEGMGDALLCAQHLLNNSFVVLHPYHLDCREFLPAMIKKFKEKEGVMLLKQPVKGRAGIAKYQKGKVVGVYEKPYKGEPDTYNISGIYILTKKFINVLKSKRRHYYDFEDALDMFVKKYNLTAHITDHNLLTLKYPWHLFEMKDYLLKKIKFFIHPKANVHSTAVLEGEVYIEEGAKISPYSVIKGPAYIGREVFIGDHALIRNKTTLERKSVIGAFSELKNCIVLENVHAQGYIADSILGKESHLAHGTITANLRFDRKQIKVKIGQKKINTKRIYLGAFFGDNSSLGIGVRTMPGVVVGNDSTVFPGTVVFDNVAPNSRYYKK